MLLMECRSQLHSGGHPPLSSAHFSSPAWTYNSDFVALDSTPKPDTVNEGAAVLQIPVRALAETHNGEVSATGRSLEECFSSSIILTGLGNDPAATFTGVFMAASQGLAHSFLQRLLAHVRDLASSKLGLMHSVLAAALKQCEKEDKNQCRGLSGCAVLLSRGTLAFCCTGSCLMTLGLCKDVEIHADDLLGRPDAVHSAHPCEEPTVSLSDIQQGRSAFGSLIPLERSAVLCKEGESGSPCFATGERRIEEGHQFLVLGIGAAAEAMSFADAVQCVQRSRSSATDAGRSAAAFATHCQQLTAKQQKQADLHATVVLLHFKLPALAFDDPKQTVTSETEPLRPESPVQAFKASQLPPLVLSPSGRRVRFLQPVHGSEFAETSKSPSLESHMHSPQSAGILLSESSGSVDLGTAPSGGFPDGSSLISSGSLLSQPNMSIPEEAALPGEHSALQLPPPLLAPIRKAYPSKSQELRITPEMLSSPSPVRKAKMGRAASLNSPEGLWPPPPAGKAVIRTSSGGEFGSRSRGCGEEGRVRGGLPRISSVPSLLAGALTPSPSASSTGSPAAAAGSRASPFSEKRPLPALSDLLVGKGRLRSSGSLSNCSMPSTGSGSKTRGQSAALRLLQASRRGETDPSSAPADLGRLLETSADAASSCDLDLETRARSSSTESIGVSSTSESVGSRRTGVRRVPVLQCPPNSQAARLSLSDDDIPPQESVQETAAAPCLLKQEGGSTQPTASRVIPVVPSVIEKSISFPQIRPANLWPSSELDSAAEVGLLSRLNSESRQHSGRAFSHSSLADSVGSLTQSLPALGADETAN